VHSREDVDAQLAKWANARLALARSVLGTLRQRPTPYVETQDPNDVYCGMHALNVFFQGPLFDAKSLLVCAYWLNKKERGLLQFNVPNSGITPSFLPSSPTSIPSVDDELEPFATPDNVLNETVENLIKREDRFYGLSTPLLLEAANQVLNQCNTRYLKTFHLPKSLSTVSFDTGSNDQNKKRLMLLIGLLERDKSVDRFMLRRNSHIITILRKENGGWWSIDCERYPKLPTGGRSQEPKPLKPINSLDEIFFSAKNSPGEAKVQTMVIDSQFVDTFESAEGVR
jgi:hypothetical protein